MNGPRQNDKERFVERDVDGLEVDRSQEEGEPFDMTPEDSEDDADA